MEGKLGAAVEARGLEKSFGSRRALRGLDLSIPRGGVFGILGPNGAGKTTTVRILAALARPDSGSVEVLGRDARKEARAVRALVGLSPQENAVAGRLSAMENLLLVAGSYGLRGRDAKARAEACLRALGLEDRARDRASALSGGLTRRLSIAMALVADPPLLFLDEPSLGLDPEARAELWRVIASTKGEKTVILTTHYLEEAEALADRVAVVVDGKVVLEDSPAGMRRRAGGGGRVRLELSGEEEAARLAAALAGAFPGLRASGARLELEGGEAAGLALLDRARAAGAVPRGFSVGEASIGEAYLAAIGKGGEA